MEGRTKDAVASYLDTIRLGRAVMRGGLIIDVLIGITCEAIGREGIANMRNSLSAGECLGLLPKLNELLDESAWSDELPCPRHSLGGQRQGLAGTS